MRFLIQKKWFAFFFLALFSCGGGEAMSGVFAVLETTQGDIKIELDAEKAPISTDNFITYAKDDFYDGTVFHRVIPNFMIQGGGFKETMERKQEGLRKPIYNEWDNGLKNKRGTIAMARTGEPHSATAQFFINVVDNANLDVPRGGAAYAVFGKVVEGMDVVDKIRNVKCINHPKYPSRQPVTPETPVVIKDVKITGTFDREKLKKKATSLSENFLKNEAEKKSELLGNKEAALEKEHGQEFVTSASGLKYMILKEGKGTPPSKTSEVTVHYRGELLNGSVFDSSYKRGQPASFPLSRVIKGWQEGITYLKPGGKAVYLIPPDLGYGRQGHPPVIPPSAWLVFTVELKSVKSL